MFAISSGFMVLSWPSASVDPFATAKTVTMHSPGTAPSRPPVVNLNVPSEVVVPVADGPEAEMNETWAFAKGSPSSSTLPLDSIRVTDAAPPPHPDRVSAKEQMKTADAICLKPVTTNN